MTKHAQIHLLPFYNKFSYLPILREPHNSSGPIPRYLSLKSFIHPWCNMNCSVRRVTSWIYLQSPGAQLMLYIPTQLFTYSNYTQIAYKVRLSCTNIEKLVTNCHQSTATRIEETSAVQPAGLFPTTQLLFWVSSLLYFCKNKYISVFLGAVRMLEFENVREKEDKKVSGSSFWRFFHIRTLSFSQCV